MLLEGGRQDHPTPSGLSDSFGRIMVWKISSANSAVCSWEAYVDAIIRYSQDDDLPLVLFMRGLIENSTVGIEKNLASLLVAWGRDIWLGNAPGNALSFGPWRL